MACDQKMLDLAFKLFRIFARFEYCLKVTGYCVSGHGSAAKPDWTRFSHELPPLSDEAGEEAAAAISYILKSPPKKQVYIDKLLQWRTADPQAENENDRIFLYVRRVRNNLFHGGKFNGHFFEPERSRKLLAHSITILEAAIYMCPRMREAYES